jgi:Tfp pilus assembly protein PilF
VTGAWLLGLALVTYSRATDWQDERRLWATAVAHSPEKPRPWINLGQQYQRRGQYGKAADAWRYASELTQRLGRAPDERLLAWAIAETNLAINAANRKDWIDARFRIETVIARAPQFKTPHRVLTWITRTSADSSSSASAP